MSCNRVFFGPWLALLLLALPSFTSASEASVADPTIACRVAGIKTEARCGRLVRALDPARAGGPQISVHFVVLRSVARNRKPDPVFMLAGGPGQSAISLAGTVFPWFERLLLQRDLVLVDQRGTGQSAPLMCPSAPTLPFSWANTQAQELAQCRAALERLPYITAPADLGLFTTTLAMQDLDAVRQALGAEQINLVGASYGTRAALEYMRQFGAHVRRSVLDGVAPPDMVLPTTIGPDSQAALDGLWASCSAQGHCQKAFPTLSADWQALWKNLPKTVTLAHPMTGQATTVSVTPEAVMGAVRGALYTPALAAALPQAVHDAARGHFEGLAGLASTVQNGAAHMRLAMGMHLGVVCAEDYSRMAAAPTASTPNTDPQAHYRAACRDWPQGAVPAEFYQIPATQHASLLLSGGLDPVTPPRHAQRVQQALGPLARHVVVPQVGHGVLSHACMHKVLTAFIQASDNAKALAIDASCAHSIPRPLAFVRPVESTSGSAP